VAPSDAERHLEALLVAAATDPAQRPAFTAALLEADVCVLGTVEGEVTDGVAAAGASMRIVGLADDEGDITPFFTSEQAVQVFLASQPETDPSFVRLRCRALFEMTRGARLVLNPASAYGKVFVPEEIAALLAGEEPGLTTQVLEEDQQVLIGAPAHVPPELPAVLTRFFAQRPVVEAAHLGWIARAQGEPGYLLVVVAADADQAMAGFGSVAIGDVTDGRSIDVMVVAPGADNPLAGTVPAFYTRSAPPGA
jgi:hypothetical protein